MLTKLLCFVSYTLFYKNNSGRSSNNYNPMFPVSCSCSRSTKKFCFFLCCCLVVIDRFSVYIFVCSQAIVLERLGKSTTQVVVVIVFFIDSKNYEQRNLKNLFIYI